MIGLAVLTLSWTAAQAGSDDCNRAAFLEHQRIKRSELVSKVSKLLERSKQISAQQSAVADQRLKVVQMNSITRGVKSLGDPNYDIKHLDELSDALRAQFDAVRQEAAFLQLGEQALGLAQQEFDTRCPN